jgi:TPR repeat protein
MRYVHSSISMSALTSTIALAAIHQDVSIASLPNTTTILSSDASSTCPIVSTTVSSSGTSNTSIRYIPYTKWAKAFTNKTISTVVSSILHSYSTPTTATSIHLNTKNTVPTIPIVSTMPILLTLPTPEIKMDYTRASCYAFTIAYEWTQFQKDLSDVFTHFLANDATIEPAFTSTPATASIDNLQENTIGLFVGDSKRNGSSETSSLTSTSCSSSTQSSASSLPTCTHPSHTTSLGMGSNERQLICKVKNNLGYILLHGLFDIPKNIVTALEMFKEAADEGDAYGCYNYAWMSRDGIGTSRDVDVANKSWKKAEEIGFTSVHVTKNPHDNNNNNNNTNGFKFETILQRHVETIHAMYIAYALNSDMKLNYVYYIIGRCYDEGLGCTINTSLALEWWTRGLHMDATNNHADCEYALGYYYMNLAMEPTKNNNINKYQEKYNKEKYKHTAIDYFKSSMNYGHVSGMYYLHDIYHTDSSFVSISADEKMKVITALQSAADRYWLTTSLYTTANLLVNTAISPIIDAQFFHSSSLYPPPSTISSTLSSTLSTSSASTSSISLTTNISPISSTSSTPAPSPSSISYITSPPLAKTMDINDIIPTTSVLNGSNTRIYDVAEIIGNWYRHGQYITNEPDDVKALIWLTIVAQQPHGDGAAENILGCIYLESKDPRIKHDQSRAFYYFQKSAEHNNNGNAQFNLSTFYRQGRCNVNQDLVLSFQWLERASVNNSGCFTIRYWMGRYYDQGWGTPRNPIKALEWFQKAASHPTKDGRPDYMIGDIYQFGRYEDILPDAPTSITTSPIVIPSTNNTSTSGTTTTTTIAPPTAQLKKTIIPKNTSLAFDYYQKAAFLGHAVAQYNLALYYHDGGGDDKKTKEDTIAKSSKKDDRLAFEWMLKAAKQGHVNSMSTVGIWYREGTGIERNYIKAIHWLRLADRDGAWMPKYHLDIHISGSIEDLIWDETLLSTYFKQHKSPEDYQRAWDRFIVSCRYLLDKGTISCDNGSDYYKYITLLLQTKVHESTMKCPKCDCQAPVLNEYLHSHFRNACISSSSSLNLFSSYSSSSLASLYSSLFGSNDSLYKIPITSKFSVKSHICKWTKIKKEKVTPRIDTGHHCRDFNFGGRLSTTSSSIDTIVVASYSCRSIHYTGVDYPLVATIVFNYDEIKNRDYPFLKRFEMECSLFNHNSDNSNNQPRLPIHPNVRYPFSSPFLLLLLLFFFFCLLCLTYEYFPCVFGDG